MSDFKSWVNMSIHPRLDQFTSLHWAINISVGLLVVQGFACISHTSIVSIILKLTKSVSIFRVLVFLDNSIVPRFCNISPRAFRERCGFYKCSFSRGHILHLQYQEFDPCIPCIPDACLHIFFANADSVPHINSVAIFSQFSSFVLAFTFGMYLCRVTRFWFNVIKVHSNISAGHFG